MQQVEEESELGPSLNNFAVVFYWK